MASKKLFRLVSSLLTVSLITAGCAGKDQGSPSAIESTTKPDVGFGNALCSPMPAAQYGYASGSSLIFTPFSNDVGDTSAFDLNKCEPTWTVSQADGAAGGSSSNKDGVLFYTNSSAGLSAPEPNFYIIDSDTGEKTLSVKLPSDCRGIRYDWLNNWYLTQCGDDYNDLPFDSETGIQIEGVTDVSQQGLQLGELDQVVGPDLVFRQYSEDWSHALVVLSTQEVKWRTATEIQKCTANGKSLACQVGNALDGYKIAIVELDTGESLIDIPTPCKDNVNAFLSMSPSVLAVFCADTRVTYAYSVVR